MKYAIIAGSPRQNSQSEKIAKYLKGRLEAQAGKAEVKVLSLAGNPLPQWDEGVWAKTESWAQAWGPFSRELAAAEAAVFVVPEYAGMVPPVFKNFLLLCTSELRHKPVLITTVSAGTGGSYPVSELRMSGYKNTFINYLPEHLIVRHAPEVLNEGKISEAHDEARLRGRIDDALQMLSVYGQAFRGIRETKETDLSKHAFGM